jgi:hypothetical protein
MEFFTRFFSYLKNVPRSVINVLSNNTLLMVQSGQSRPLLSLVIYTILQGQFFLE